MKKFVHIGMPKTMSSALQEGFFSVQNDIHFLGVGVGSLIDYVDDEINRLFESLIPFSCEDYYQNNKLEAVELFNEQVEEARNKEKKWVGVSSEWLGLNLTPEMVDPEVKIRRLSEVVGCDAHILIIIRSQTALLKSLYAQLVKEGLPKSFGEFCEYLWDFQDRNMLFELLYSYQYERLCRCFKKERIHYFVLEEYRDSSGMLLEGSDGGLIGALRNLLGLPLSKNIDLPMVNPSMSQKEVYQKLVLNREHRHDFGNLIFDPSNVHRSRKQLIKVSGEYRDFFSDVRLKRELIYEAKKRAGNDSQEVDYSVPDRIKNRLEDLFIEENKRFEFISGVKLNSDYFMRF